ncbi:MAG: ATP-binding protein, partial [Candidatus Methanoperedens sp.]|nr:ATP-binding protein [Candidatus Methanoperedens sp.]
PNRRVRVMNYVNTLNNSQEVISPYLGYMDLTKDSASLFFQLVSRRYERGSIILNTNRPFEEWGSLFKDNIIATAILDRLLHHSHVFYITGKSYRMKRHNSKSGEK